LIPLDVVQDALALRSPLMSIKQYTTI